MNPFLLSQGSQLPALLSTGIMDSGILDQSTNDSVEIWRDPTSEVGIKLMDNDSPINLRAKKPRQDCTTL